MSSPTDGASAGSCGNAERQESAVPASTFTGGSATGRRRRLQRRSVSANAVSDVFYRAYNSHHRETSAAAAAPHVNDGIIIEHTYFADEEDEEEELHHHNYNYHDGHEATSEYFGRAEHPLVSHHQLLQGRGRSRISGPSDAGSSQDASNAGSIGSPLRRNGASAPVRNRHSAGITNRLTDTLGLIHPTSPGTRRRLLPRGGGRSGAPAIPSTYPPIVSPFRMMPTASNTALSRRIKILFGIAVVMVVCTVAPLELRGVWRDRQRAVALEVGGDTIITDGRVGSDTPTKYLSETIIEEKVETDELVHQPRQRASALHPNPTIGPNPGPFASQAYANLHPPTRPDSIFGRISRHLLNLRLRISSRRNERLNYLEQQAAAVGMDDDDDFTYTSLGVEDTIERGEGNATMVTTRQKRRERRQRRKERRERARSARQQIVTPYTILDSEQLYRRMVALTEQYPELVRLENAQAAFGLPAVGGPKDCPFEPPELGEGCHNWYLVIEDGIYNGRGGLTGDASFASEAAAAKAEDSHSPPVQGGDGGRNLEEGIGSDADPYSALPEVILSGALHGDERVGPTAVLETAAILLESAYCESLPRMVSGDGSIRTNGGAESEDETIRRVEKKRTRHEFKHKNVPSIKHKSHQVRRRRKRLVLERRRRRQVTNVSNRRTERDYIEKRKRQRRQELLAQSPRSTAATYYPSEQLDEARLCRSSLTSRGIPGSERRWLARLVSTRRIVIVPSANSVGYFRGVRDEGDTGGLDPNRDFPYDLSDPSMCMRTIAGRTMNELFREHLFQMGITFHGGMEAVAYEWGAPSYQLPDAPKQAASQLNPAPSYAAPDSVSQKQISHIYSSYGGKFIKNGGDQYPVGTMNELVYPVEGGMEDWSYAASWDTDRVVRCTPTTYGGYPSEKTRYSPGNLRTFNALVETSNEKTPRDADLGTDEDLLTPYGAGNGHISRNVRLSLSLIDLVEPYVQILDAAGRELRDDVVPLSPRWYRSSMKTKAMAVPEGTGNTTIGWTVGGAVSVDSTALMIGRWDDLDGTVFNGMTQPTKQQLDDYFAGLPQGGDPMVWFSEAQGPGPAKWNERLGFYDPASLAAAEPGSAASINEDIVPEAVYRTSIDLSQYVAGDRIAVYAVARVDQSWAGQEDNVLGSIRPQTNVVNARTDPLWRQEYVADDGTHKIVQGRLDWFSIPLTIEVGPPRAPMLETSVRSPMDDYSPDFQQLSTRGLFKALIVGAAFALVAVMCILAREASDGNDCFAVIRQRKRIRQTALPAEAYGMTSSRLRRRRVSSHGSSFDDDDDLDYAIS